jgi:hypothetical protein
MKRLELERERALVEALRGLARDLQEPPFDPQREQVLLTLFDDACARRDARREAPVWTGLAAAALIFGAVLLWQFTSRPGAPGIGAPSTAMVAPEIDQAQVLAPRLPIASAEPLAPRAPGPLARPAPALSPATFSDVTDFVAWPGAAAWPPFESGELIRVEFPVDGGVVEADVVVGQDGFARAIRLVR